MPSGLDPDNATNANVPPPSASDRRDVFTPNNVFTINDRKDAYLVTLWLKENFNKSQDNVVIYGFGIDFLCAIHAMIELGIPCERIILVEPPLNYQMSCFNNQDLDNTITQMLNNMGVTIYTGYVLALWNEGIKSMDLKSASFTSCTKPLRLQCSAFICYHKRAVDYDAFQAVSKASLVFDGKLVIDVNFHASDVCIRAAGPFTKFARRYHSDPWTHANYNSKEVGIQLAMAMLPLFDPTLPLATEQPSDQHALAPVYRSPRVINASLPQGYYYLHISKPHINIALHVQMAMKSYGRVFITGSLEEGNYFRLHLNTYNSVETITCLSMLPLEVSNLICLYGLHEKFLNNLVSRFEEGLIKDFYSFFRETWTTAIYHDRFPDFRDEVRELLMTTAITGRTSLDMAVRRLIENQEDNKQQLSILEEEFVTSGIKEAIETRLLSFINYNEYHLPMYVQPGWF